MPAASASARGAWARRRPSSAPSSSASSRERAAVRKRSSSRRAWLNKLQGRRPLRRDLDDLRPAPAPHRFQEMAEGEGHPLEELFLLDEGDHAAAGKLPALKDVADQDLLADLLVDQVGTHRDAEECGEKDETRIE